MRLQALVLLQRHLLDRFLLKLLLLERRLPVAPPPCASYR